MTPSGHNVAAARVAAIIDEWAKTVAREADTFLVELSEYTVAIWNGTGTRGELSRWFRSNLGDWAQRIYLEGMTDCGMDAATARDLDDDDLDIIEAWVTSQREHVPGYVDAAAEAAKGTPAEKESKQRAVIARMDYWRASLASLGQQACARAQKNPMCYWRLGNAEDHCETCPRLAAGSPHRFSWFVDRGYTAGTPGSATECGGYRCQCEIRTVKGDKLMMPV